MLEFFFSNRKKTVDFNACFQAIEVDIHSHLIPNIDDGAPDISTSISLIRQMRELGLKKIITTPHVSELYPNTNDSVLDGLIQINQQIKLEGIDIELSVAAEYMVNDIFEQAILDNETLLTLPQSHILIEMPQLSEPVNIYRVLALLNDKGYKPILAHPERYRFYNRDIIYYEKLKQSGCLFQMNALSILGYYGHSVSDCAWLLLNNKMIDFVGSDIHHFGHIKALKKSMTLESQRLLDSYPFKNKTVFGA